MTELVEAARAGDEDAFSQLVRRHERELQVHCYRMLGSFTESEDLVQETFLRAWRGLDGFEGRSSVRAWLYRIATNACLDVLAQRRQRVMPYDVVPASTPDAPSFASGENAWVEPYPEHLLASRADHPEDAVISRETIELAFLAAIQHLPPRQRAVLVFRDVLGWPAKDTAELLDMTETGVKSMLQRARPALRRHLPARRDDWTPDEDPGVVERVILQRYVEAHESDDVRALADLLLEDVRVSYPQMGMWCAGREDFVVGSRKFAPPGEYRLVATRANHQPAVAIYLKPPGGADFQLTALELLRLENGRIAEIVDFDLPHLSAAFGLLLGP